MSSTLKISFLLLLVVTLGCTDEFLEREPLDQLSAENFYQTSEDLRLAALAAYTPHQDAEWLGKGWIITDMPSDDGGDAFGNPFDNFTANSGNVDIANWWAIRYRGVTMANVLINRAPTATEVGEEEIAATVAEGKFLRAVAYFDLVRAFGRVPLILEEPSNDIDLFYPQSEVNEVYDQIKADLSAAIELLPLRREGTDVGRATSGAARSYLAKVHLTLKEWEAARDQAEAVVNSQAYELTEDYGENWVWPNSDNNSESVFQVQFAGCGPWGTGNAMQAFFSPWNEGITKVADGWGSMIPTGPRTFQPGTTIRDIWEEGDLRRYYTLMEPDNYYPMLNPEDGGYTYPTDGASAENINIKKYVIGGGTNVCLMSTPINGHLIRYADVLLMLAEAYVELGSGVTLSGSALSAFNAVRTRAGLPEVESIDREAIHQERRAELAFEGQRWFDLIRWGIALETLRLHGKTLDEHNLLFPIPQGELELNANLQQNFGY